MSGISTSQKYAILRTGTASDGRTGMSLDTFGDMEALARQAFRHFMIDNTTAQARAFIVSIQNELDDEITSYLPGIRP